MGPWFVRALPAAERNRPEAARSDEHHERAGLRRDERAGGSAPGGGLPAGALWL